jgi:omega-amidase
MEIIGLQWDLAWEDKPANFAHARRLLDKAAPAPGALVVLPEMFATGFSMNAKAIAEPADGETIRFLSSLAREFGVFTLAGVVAAGDNGLPRNEAVILGPDGREISRYCKMHPFRPAGEGEHYLEGDAPSLWSWGGIAVSPFICYDLRFPEIFRMAVRKGAEIFVVIASWPSVRAGHWRTLLQARAIENQAYVIGVNRCGSDPRLPYPGATMLVAFDGEVQAELGGAEGFLKTSIDVDSLRAYRARLPFLRDLRSDLLFDRQHPS